MHAPLAAQYAAWGGRCGKRGETLKERAAAVRKSYLPQFRLRDERVCLALLYYCRQLFRVTYEDKLPET